MGVVDDYLKRKREEQDGGGRGGILGTGIGPDFKLGLGDLASELRQVPGALIHLGSSLAPGGTPAGEPWSQFGKGMAASFLGTAATPFAPLGKFNPVEAIGDKVLGDNQVQDFFERAGDRGIASSLFEDIGNVALGGAGVGQVAKLGKARAAGAAARAGSPSQAAKLANQAARLGEVQAKAQTLATPYRSVGRRVVRPLSRAGAEARGVQGPVQAAQAAAREARPAIDLPTGAPTAPRSAAAPAPDLAAPPPPTRRTDLLGFERPQQPAPAGAAQRALSAEDILPDVRRTAEPVVPEGQLPPAARSSARKGPARRAAEAAQEAPVPEWARRFVSGRSQATQRRLAGLEQRIQRGELRRITREQEIFADAARRGVMASEPVQAMYGAAKEHLLERRQLPDGTEITPSIADDMFGDAVRNRLTGVEAAVDQVKGLVAEETLANRGITGRHRIPDEWLSNPDGSPTALNESITEAATAVRELSDQQLNLLVGDRLGAQGLERIGVEDPILTKTDKRKLSEVRQELGRIERARRRNAAQRRRLEQSGPVAEDSAARAVALNERANRIEGALNEFNPQRSPELFRSPQWGRVLREFVTEVSDIGDGATLNPALGRTLKPKAFGGTDTGWVVGVRELSDRVPMEEWNRVVDPATGATHGEQLVSQLALEWQQALSNGDLSLGLWVDDSGRVAIDLTQTTADGKQITRQQARTLAAARGQEAVFDFTTGDTVFIDKDPRVAEAFLDKHRARDRRARTYEDALERERRLAREEGRDPRITQEQVDAIQDMDDMVALHLHRSNPDKFPTPDDAYAAAKASVGSDPSRLPANTLFQLAGMQPGNVGAALWHQAVDRFPDWEKLAAWYDRSHQSIEAEFRGRPVTLLDGSTRDMADLMYDLVALSSVQAAPGTNMMWAGRQVLNLQRTLDDFAKNFDEAKALLQEISEQGTSGPRFAKLLLDEDLSEAKRLVEAEGVNTRTPAGLAKARARAVEVASDRLATHMGGRERRRTAMILLGRPLDTMGPEFFTGPLADVTGLKTPKTITKSALDRVRSRVEAAGRDFDAYVNELGEARARALRADPEAPDTFTPDDVRRLGEEQALREFEGENLWAKMRSFRENLATPAASDAITLDKWMARLFGEDFPAGGRYGTWADELRASANALNEQGITVSGQPVRGHHVQALLWAYSMDEATRLARLAKDHGSTVSVKRGAAQLEQDLRRLGIDPNVPRDPGQPMPPAQSFMEVMLEPNNRRILDEIARDSGYEGLGEMLREGFQDQIGQWNYKGGVRYQLAGDRIKGATWADETGQVFERFFETADPTTLVHENAHALRKLLTPEDLAGVERAYNVRKGIWTRQADEAFARDWELLTADPVGGGGVAPDALPGIAKIQRVLADAFQEVRDRGVLRRVPDETEAMYRTIFDPENLPRFESASEAKLQRRLDRAEAARRTQRRRAESARRQADAAVSTAELRKRALADRWASLEAAEGAVVKGTQRAMDKMGRVLEGLDDPSLARTPPHLQPIWHAYTSLIDEAAKTGDLRLAQAVAEMGDGLPQVVEFAKSRGFDPQYVPKMQPDQVKRVVFEGMRLGRGRDLGLESQASARRTRRYAAPESMDRSIGGLVGGYIDAIHEQNTNALVGYLEDVIAKPVPEGGRLPEGWVPWDGARQFILTGEDAGQVTVGAGTNLMIPEGIERFLRNYGNNYGHWTFNGLRKVTDPWRSMTLPLRPAWYVNNLVGNVILATAAGVRLGDWTEAWRLYRQGAGQRGTLRSGFDPETLGAVTGGIATDIADPAARRATGIELGPREVYRARRAEGRSRTSATGRGTQEAVSRISRGNEVVDDIARVATFLAKRRKGMSADDALIAAHRAMVDYGNLSGFERAFVRAAVPFYAWQKGVLGLTLKYGMDNPYVVGITLALGDLNRELQEDRYGTELPRAYSGMIDTPLGNFNLQPLNPFADAASISTVEGLGESLNPFVEVGARSLLGAPEFAGDRGATVGAIGQRRGKVDVLGELTDLLTFSAPARAARGVPGLATGEDAGVARYLGVPTFTEAEVDKIRERTIRTRAGIEGLGTVDTRRQLRSAGISAPTPPSQRGGGSAFDILGIEDPAEGVRSVVARVRRNAVPKGL